MPMIALTGQITCQPRDLHRVLALLPGHVRLTEAEPGCLYFRVVQSRCEPCTFLVAERFASRAAFDAHQTRTAASAWGTAGIDLERACQITELPDEHAT